MNHIKPDDLEAMIDSASAWQVMLAFETVLREKAEHLRVNWQDRQSARVYDRFAKRCDTLMREMEKANI